MSPELKKPIVCYVTDRKGFAAGDPLARLSEAIHNAIAAGVDWVQIREKDLPGRVLLGIVRDAVAMAAKESKPETRTRVIVNDRLEVALAGGAGGVHLGGESAPPRAVASWCGSRNAGADFSIGVSCHSLAEARAAEIAGASYVLFGTVFETPSKLSLGKPQGTPQLAAVCRAVRIPVIAIGGINIENGLECMRAGAAGVAAIRLFQEAVDLVALKAAVRKLHRFE